MRRNFAVPELFLGDSARDPGRLPHLAEGERAADDDQTPRIDFANFIKNLATILPQSEPLSPEDWDKRLCALWTTTIDGERYTLALYTTSGLAQFTLNVLNGTGPRQVPSRRSGVSVRRWISGRRSTRPSGKHAPGSNRTASLVYFGNLWPVRLIMVTFLSRICPSPAGEFLR